MEGYRYGQGTPQTRKKPKRETEDCEVEFKKTRTGLKIKVGKHCSSDQIKALQETRGIKSEDIIRED